MNAYTNQQKEKMEEEALRKAVDELDRDTLPTANIIVAGITGTGKSTLLNAVFSSDLAATGTGRPVTEQIAEYDSPDIPIHIWDTVGLELDSEKTKESVKAIRDIIANKSISDDHFDRIHAIWYCINSGSNRYQGAELDFIKNLHSSGVPFIIVLTQCIGDDDEINAFEDKIKSINSSMGMEDIEIVQVLAMDKKTKKYTIEAFGLDGLVETTIKKLPDFIKGGFIAAQKVSRAQKRVQCEEIIYRYVRAAKEGFWDKVPLVNIISANNRIMNMFKKIGGMYNAHVSIEGIERIVKESKINFSNTFNGLVNPFYENYHQKVLSLLKTKKNEGFEVELIDLDKSERVAVMIAFYGYTFISAIEELWGKLTEEQLKDVDMVCCTLIDIINKRLKEKRK